MTALLALAPCLIVLGAVLGLRASALQAALAALCCALALWGLGVFSTPAVGQLGRAATDAVVLELLVGVVIFFGLVLTETIRRAGSLQHIGAAIESLNLTNPRAVILTVLGIGVALESLTGYGVSMLVTVPLLLGLVPRRTAITLALLGMSLMTWGALSVAALLGAELAGLSADEMAEVLVTTSGPVAALLPLSCLAVLPRWHASDAVFAVGSGLALFVGIWATSHILGAELAGVGGGLAVIALTVCLARSRDVLPETALGRPLLPFALLVLAVVLQKVLVPHIAGVGLAPEIATPRVSFSPLHSPGLALFAVAFLCSLPGIGLVRASEMGSILASVVRKSWRALTTILLFLLTARLLVEAGAIAALGTHLVQLGESASAALVVVLGGLGAYATGSGVTSNALFMGSAAAAGEGFGSLSLFAALQHSGASHAAMASLPVIALLLAALPNTDRQDTRSAVRTGLILASLWLAVVTASGLVQVNG